MIFLIGIRHFSITLVHKINSTVFFPILMYRVAKIAFPLQILPICSKECFYYKKLINLDIAL